MSMIVTGGGRITCRQCNARSKRTKQQCQAPAARGRSVCRFHGGKSSGPKTPEGRARCASAKTVHGRETRAIRAQRREELAVLQSLEALGRAIGLMTGSMTRGPKVK